MILRGWLDECEAVRRGMGGGRGGVLEYKARGMHEKAKVHGSHFTRLFMSSVNKDYRKKGRKKGSARRCLPSRLLNRVC